MPNKRTNRNETINEKKSKPNQIQIGNAVLNCTVFLSSLSKKTPSSKVGDELRTNLLNVHMTIT